MIETPEQYAHLWEAMTVNERYSRQQALERADWKYQPLVVTRHVNENGKHLCLDGNATMKVCILNGHAVLQVMYVDVAPEDVNYEMLERQKRKRLTRRTMSVMIPLLEEYYARKNEEKKARGEKIKYHVRKHISLHFENMGDGIGEVGVSEIKFLDAHPATRHLIDKLDVGTPMNAAMKTAKKIIACEVAEVPAAPNAPVTQEPMPEMCAHCPHHAEKFNQLNPIAAI